MAMSQSFRDSGSDEARDEVVDICSYCATSDKLQPATHFCFDCGPCGRYICGICLRHHKLFLGSHGTIYTGNQANIDRNQKNMHDRKEVLELKKKNDQQETLLKQQSDELEKRKEYIQKLENKVKDLESENQKNIHERKEVQQFKKKNDQRETLLKHQNAELEKRREYIRELENRVKDLKSEIRETFERENAEIKKSENALDDAKKKISEYEEDLKKMYTEIALVNKERDYLKRRRSVIPARVTGPDP